MARVMAMSVAMSLLLASTLAVPTLAQDEPGVDAASLERWCVANAPDDVALEACREAARSLLASRDGVSPPEADDLLDGVSSLLGEVAGQIDLSGAEDALDEALRAVDEAIARIDPAGAVTEARSRFDEAIAQMDLDGANGALDEAIRLAQAVEDWVRENPDEVCDLGAVGVGYVVRAGVLMLTGSPYLSQVAYETAQDAVVEACPAGGE